MTDRAKKGPAGPLRWLVEGGKALGGVLLVLAVAWLAFSLGAWLQERNTPLAYWAGIGAETLFTLGRDLTGAADAGRVVESGAFELSVKNDPPDGPLLAVAEGTRALLFDRTGAVAHRWDVRHGDAFPRSDLPDDAVTWREPVLMPNGDLIAVHHRRALLRPTDFRGQRHGLGVVRLAPDGTVRWATPIRAHHVPVLTADGDLLVLWRKPRDQADPRYPDVHQPVFDEGVARLDPQTGAVMRRASFFDLFAGSGFENLLHTPAVLRDGFRLKGELFHANTVRPVGPEAGRHAPYADAGDLVVSLRNLSTAAVLDAETWAVKTLLRGPWVAQHDVEVRPDGTVAAFDNIAPDHGSRVVVWNPPTGAIVRTFGADDLDTPTRGARQHLPGGGTLAVDARGMAIAYAADGSERWRLRLPPKTSFLLSVRRVPRRRVARFLKDAAGAGQE